MKKLFNGLAAFIVFFTSCSTNDVNISVQGNAVLLPWSIPMSNAYIFMQDENSRHNNIYYNRIDTHTDNNGFYQLSNKFDEKATLTLGFVPNNYNTIIERSGAIQLKEGKQIINFNCYCYAQSQIQLTDSSLLSPPPDSIIFDCTNIIKSFRTKINTNYFSNPTTLYLNQIAGYPNIIECNVFRNGIITKTDTIINSSSCNQISQINFNY